jgi:MFS family permease
MALSKLKAEFGFLRGNFLILILSWILMSFAGRIPETYYSLYVKALGGSAFIVGLIGFSSFIALALVQFPGGYLADRYGRRWLIITMTFGVAFFYLFYALAPTWQFIFMGAVMQSLCLIYQPALRAITADSLQPVKRGMGFSLQSMLTRIAVLPSPIIAGILLAYYGELVYCMRVAYAITFCFFLGAAILRFRRLQETLRQNDSQNPSLHEIVRGYPEMVREGFGVWKKVPKSMLYLFASRTILRTFLWMCNPFFVLYATEVLLIEKETQWPLILTWWTAAGILSALPVGKIIDRVGRKKPLIISISLFIPAMLLFIYGNFPLLLASFTLLGIGWPLFYAAHSSLEADLVPRRYRGKITGCSQFIFFIFLAINQLLGGYLYDYVSPQIPFFLVTLATIPSIIIVALLVHEPKTREL